MLHAHLARRRIFRRIRIMEFVPTGAIGMRPQGVRSATSPDRSNQCVGDELACHYRAHRPADGTVRSEIDDGSNIQRALRASGYKLSPHDGVNVASIELPKVGYAREAPRSFTASAEMRTADQIPKATGLNLYRTEGPGDGAWLWPILYTQAAYYGWISCIYLFLGGRTQQSITRPLQKLQMLVVTELYRGLVRFSDRSAKTAKRIAPDRRHLAEFGAAAECGFFRRDPATSPGCSTYIRAPSRLFDVSLTICSPR
jgi:hypothetical protein